MPYFKNDQLNLLFIHIPKTGGTSLENYFSSKYDIKLNNDSLFNSLENNIIQFDSSLQHLKYTSIIKNKDFFKIDNNNLKIITIVRNPYDRIVSDLFFLKSINVDSSCAKVYNEIKSYIIRNRDNHGIPQYQFLIDENNKLIDNIKILHTETLNNDMYNLGYTDFNLKANTNSKKVNYIDYLNNDSIRLINNFYDNDFKLFNYNKINRCLDQQKFFILKKLKNIR